MAELAAARRRKRRRQAIIFALTALVALGLIYLVSRSNHKAASKRPVSRTAAAKAAASHSTPGCPPAGGSAKRRTSFPGPPPMCISASASYSATVRTTAGNFVIALSNASPRTVNDFVFLARYHFYDGTIFHRVVKGFVVQGGDPNPPTASNPNPGPQGPGYTVAGEVPPAGSYHLGTVAMAKTATAPPGTTGSQFFVVMGPSAESLPPQYSILGTVTKGMGTLQKIMAGGSASPSGTPHVTYRIISVSISKR